MIGRPVGFAFCPFRHFDGNRPGALRFAATCVFVLAMGTPVLVRAQVPDLGTGAPTPSPAPVVDMASPTGSIAAALPLAIVSIEASGTVTGALRVTDGKAIIASSGSTATACRRRLSRRFRMVSNGRACACACFATKA